MAYGIEQLHSYSHLFSSHTCAQALRFQDVEDVRAVCNRFDKPFLESTECTVWDYLSKVYSILKRYYRNEYVYKNELINACLKDKSISKDTVIINEFGVGRSIADITMFNGSSKAFEIKSELDSDKRLANQMFDYQQLFDECYIVVPECAFKKYMEVVDENVGVFVLSHTSRGAVSIHKERHAEKNRHVNVDILMQSVRTPEYKWMVQQINGYLPDVSCFQMYDVCKEILRGVPDDRLHQLFNSAVKMRKTQIGSLADKYSYVRQMFLSIGVSRKKELELINLYNEKL